MSTLRALRKIERETFDKGNELRRVPLGNDIRKTRDSYQKITNQQKELKDKNKFCWGLIKALEKEKENEEN